MEECFHNMDPRFKHKTLYIALTCDGTEVQKNISYTPIVMRVLNLPPAVRLHTHSRLSLYV